MTITSTIITITSASQSDSGTPKALSAASNIPVTRWWGSATSSARFPKESQPLVKDFLRFRVSGLEF